MALTKAKASLLEVALTGGVEEDLLRVALTQARTDTLSMALHNAEVTLVAAALTKGVV